MKLIDSHAHLDFKDFHNDFEEVLERAEEAGVEKIINIGVDIESSKHSILLAENHSNIFATVGIHPTEFNELGLTESINELENLIKSSRRVVGIGECGLDYYHVKDKLAQEKQRLLFEAQIELAQGHHLPLVLHIRNGEDGAAYEDALNILQKNKVDFGVVHCFTFGPCEAKAFLDLGLYIGFTGIVTYEGSVKNANNIQEAAKIVPLDRLLVETDSPFLAPQKYRGQRNESAYVTEVAIKIAEIKNISPEEVSLQTTQNVLDLFKI